MMHSTPEERGCQVPEGEFSPAKAFPNPADARKATELLAQAKTPRERELVKAMLKDASEKFVVGGITIDNSKAVIDKGLTPSELNNIVTEVSGHPLQTPITKVIEACNQPSESPAKAKSIAESKKLLTNFKESLEKYPKYLTYEGSVVLCVAVSVNEGKAINLGGLPQSDRDTITASLPPEAPNKLAKGEAWVDVEFDELKDFVISYRGGSAPFKANFFNTVIHPQQLPDTHVPIEKEGGKVMVGSNLVLDQRRIAKLVGLAPHDKNKGKEDDEEIPQRRQPIAGRNAYEIRADVLQMAIDWVREKDEYNQKDENDVLSLAKKFYSFVEDRRR
jgi:hypothetical protein